MAVIQIGHMVPIRQPMVRAADARTVDARIGGAARRRAEGTMRPGDLPNGGGSLDDALGRV